jgi:hypothetical protein
MKEPSAMTTILFDSTRTRKPETFAHGIPSLGRRPYTLADLDWAAQAFGDAEAGVPIATEKKTTNLA